MSLTAYGHSRLTGQDQRKDAQRPAPTPLARVLPRGMTDDGAHDLEVGLIPNLLAPHPKAPYLRPDAVLVVDDDSMIRAVLETVLHTEGMVAHTAENLDQALATLATQPVDVILTDSLAPCWGAEALRSVRELVHAAGGAPVMLLTGHSQAVDLDLAREGVAAVISKPFDVDDLLGHLHACCQAPRTLN